MSDPTPPAADLSRWSPSPELSSVLDDAAVPDPATLELLAVEIVEFVGAEFRRERGLSAAGSMSDAADRTAFLDVATKSTDTDPVTRLDTLFEANIRAILTRHRPQDAQLGEEGGGEIADSGVTWIADPVDGTVNLMYGLPLSAVSLGASVDGEFVAGAVHALGLGETFAAHSGGGARTRRWPVGVAPEIGPVPGPWERLEVSDVSDLGKTLVATGFGYAAELRREQGRVVAELLPQVRDIRRLGAAALDLCLVAAGRIDAYYERGLKVWDFAAGAVIVKEAGGVFHLPESPAEPVVAGGRGVVGDLAEMVGTRIDAPGRSSH